MDLTKALLPSPDHLLLLKYLLVLMSSILIPYAGMILGGIFFSLALNLLGAKRRDTLFRSSAIALVSLTMGNRGVCVALGVVPLVAVVFISSQLLYGASVLTTTLLLYSAVLFVLGYLFAFLYKGALQANRSSGYALLTGGLSFLLLAKALFMFVSALGLLTEPGRWELVKSPFDLFYSWDVVARYLHYLTAVFALTGAGYFFMLNHYHAKAGFAEKSDLAFARKLGVGIALGFSLVQPPLIFWNVIMLPDVALSWAFMVTSFLTLLLFLIVCRATLPLLSSPEPKAGNSLFVLSLCALFLIIVCDHFSRESALKEQTASIVAQAADRAGMEGVPPALKAKGCLACHTIDGKTLVGPSFKGIVGRKTVVLVKGEEKSIDSDEEYIKRSIREPAAEVVKGFQPLMPPQSLNDAELQEIIQYLKSLK